MGDAASIDSSRVLLEVVHRRDGNTVGLLDDRALIFVRSRALTGDALEAIDAAIRRVVPKATAEQPAGALAILPGDAGLSHNDLLARQRQIFGEARKQEHIWVSMCVHGHSAQTIAMRAVVRLLLLGHGNMRMHATPEAAIAACFAAHLRLSVRQGEKRRWSRCSRKGRKRRSNDSDARDGEHSASPRVSTPGSPGRASGTSRTLPARRGRRAPRSRQFLHHPRRPGRRPPACTG